MSKFGQHYRRVARYVLEQHVRPGRDAAWRASLILGCAYALSVVIGLTVMRYAFGTEISSFETMLVAWLVGGVIAVLTYALVGRRLSGEAADATQQGPPGFSLLLVALSTIAVMTLVATVAQLLRAA